jgi:predicted nuclease with RNAse H fold
MLTAGLDLAAEPKGTALCEIEWRAGAARVVSLHVGVDNDTVASVAGRVEKLGIDCAFGWPDEFVAFVAGHSSGQPLNPPMDHGMPWRRRLAFRETDRDVERRIGKRPLSVATDRLGLTAIRCAVILDQLAAAGHDVDRSGAGLVAEIYPGAALLIWDLAVTGSKRDDDILSQLVDRLVETADWLDLGEWVHLMRRSHDAFDAVIAALNARAVAIGQSSGPSLELVAQAGREGWVRLPEGPLSLLRE